MTDLSQTSTEKPSEILYKYLASPPTINEALWDSTSTARESPTQTRTKKMSNMLDDWQSSWDAMKKDSTKEGKSKKKDSKGHKGGSKRTGSSKDTSKK